MTWRTKYKVHPAADVFPMMSDDELKALGADIEENGLNEPIQFLVPREMGGRTDAALCKTSTSFS